MPQIYDTIALDAPRLTRDGYMVCEARAARTGIYRYRGVEVGMPDKEHVRVYRPADEIFDKKAMESFTSLPITLDHPPEMVDASNWRKYARGFTGEDVLEDKGEGSTRYVRVPIILKDADTIKAVSGGQRELSFGYTCDFDPTPGKTEDGEKYDLVQRNLRGNHLAIVPTGRAGPACRMGDGDDRGDVKMLKTITQDGIPLEVTDAGATVISTLNQRVRDANETNLRITAEHGAALAAKDAEIKRLDTELGKRDGEIRQLKDAQLDERKIDALVAERTSVIADAVLVAPDLDYKGKPANDIRRAAVVHIEGDKIKDKSDDYVSALFDKFVENAKGSGPARADPIYDTMARTVNVPKSAADVHAKMVADMGSAWQTQPAGRA